MMTASAVVPPSLSIPVKTRGLIKWQTKHTCCNPASLPMRLQPFSTGGIQGKVCLSHPVGLGLQLQPISRSCGRKQSATVICAAALNARCSASGQTQTVTRQAPTITQAPTHANEKSPQLDDGGTGFPPRDDGGGGGGRGGGGGNFSGGFFLFGLLAFLGFLKDKETEEGYKARRRR
ncbi:hypothetical protein SLE2022_020190 [Rubroshorea leprosula]